MSEKGSHRSSRDFTRSHEPIAWALFSSGGVVVAMVFPALIVCTGLLVQLGWADESLLAFERVHMAFQVWWAKLLILVVIALPIFHAAHRIYHGLHDLHVPLPRKPGQLLFYGGATLLTAFALMLLVSIG